MKLLMCILQPGLSQGGSSVLFTVSSLETQKNKPQTDWPHFPASEQRNAPLLLPEQMAEAKQRVRDNKDEQVSNGRGDSRTSGARRALISIGVQSRLPGAGRPRFYFEEKVCIMIWQEELGLEPIIWEMNPPWERS